jgi:hypothetical protein
VAGSEASAKGPDNGAMNGSYRQKKHPTILALSDDHDLIEVLLKNCSRPWKLKVSVDMTSYRNLTPNGDCRVVVVDDEKLQEADRG